MPVEAVPEPLPSASYLDVGQADDLAAGLPGLAAYRSANDDAKAAALAEASSDVDAAMPYHGRRFDAGQPTEFPRVADEPASAPGAGPGVVWDWDAAAGRPVVPADVCRAVLCEADSILAGVREPRIDAQHDGVVYKLGGGEAESFKATPGPGVPTGLCRRAWMLMRKYHLRSGRLA